MIVKIIYRAAVPRLNLYVGKTTEAECQIVMTHITALNRLLNLTRSLSLQHLANHTSDTKHGHRQSG